MTDFSIVIPNLNQSKFLSWAFESLKSQDEIPFEIALVDGGSTDGFKQAMEPYQDMVSWMRVGPDSGQAAAISDGLKEISGDIVAWLNADDYYFPKTLFQVAACFENDPALDVVYGDAVHVDENGFFLSYFPHTQTFDPDLLPSSCYICQPACFVRRKAYESVGGVNPELCYTMDWDLWCKLAQKGAKFHYLPKLLAAVRHYQGTKTSSCNPARYKEIRKIERVYKKTGLPLSWLGFYLHDLAEKKNRRTKDIPTFFILDALRRLKHKWEDSCRYYSPYRIKGKIQGRRKIHGFDRVTMQVEHKGSVHIPWYDRRQWKRLYLEIEPNNTGYHVDIDGRYRVTIFPNNGRFIIDLPKSNKKERVVSIQPVVIDNPWEILRFSCDLFSDI